MEDSQIRINTALFEMSAMTVFLLQKAVAPPSGRRVAGGATLQSLKVDDIEFRGEILLKNSMTESWDNGTNCKSFN